MLVPLPARQAPQSVPRTRVTFVLGTVTRNAVPTPPVLTTLISLLLLMRLETSIVAVVPGISHSVVYLGASVGMAHPMSPATAPAHSFLLFTIFWGIEKTAQGGLVVARV